MPINIKQNAVCVRQDGGEYSGIDVFTDETTADAIADWLDEHPEATTTVSDGSVTLPKLNSSLQDVIVIKDTSEIAYYHDTPPLSATFYSNSIIGDAPIGYANSENLLEGLFDIGTYGNVLRTPNGRLLMMSGTATSGTVIIDTNNKTAANQRIAGKTLKFCLYINKSEPWTANTFFKVQVVYPSGHTPSAVTLVKKYVTENGRELFGWTTFDVEFPSDTERFYVRFDSAPGVFVEGDFLWVGAYETEPIITESTTSNGNVTIETNGMSCLDSLIHPSTIKQVVPIKQYVDEHTTDIIGYWNERIYALPEDFGAVGDGVADDGLAISNCIAYAATHNMAVRGYKKYKTSSTITLNAKYLDVYLREINYTGNGYAVDLQHMDMRFEFHRIVSSGSGLNFGKNALSDNYARRCCVIGNEISSNGDCVIAQGMTLYNTCDIRYLSSANGNCITFSQEATAGDFTAAEYVFRSCSCACPNGYAISSPSGSKFYDFTIEGNCKYGILNPNKCVFSGFRHREQVDRIRLRVIYNNPEYTNGALLVFTKSPNGDGCSGNKYISADALPWYAIDTSALQGYSEFPSGDASPWHYTAYSGVYLGNSIRGVENNSRQVFADDVCFIGNHKVFVLNHRIPSNITETEVDFTPIDGGTDTDIYNAYQVLKFLGTDFTIDVSHSDIYLNASFGAIGYNDLTVTQHDGNTCTIYDKLGDVLFDGTNLGDGVWSLKCIMDKSSNGRYQGNSSWWCYDGTNEKWEITELSDGVESLLSEI